MDELTGQKCSRGHVMHFVLAFRTLYEPSAQAEHRADPFAAAKLPASLEENNVESAEYHQNSCMHSSIVISSTLGL